MSERTVGEILAEYKALSESDSDTKENMTGEREHKRCRIGEIMYDSNTGDLFVCNGCVGNVPRWSRL